MIYQIHISAETVILVMKLKKKKKGNEVKLQNFSDAWKSK